jgi:hypothetical protein
VLEGPDGSTTVHVFLGGARTWVGIDPVALGNPALHPPDKMRTCSGLERLT